jgi:hypothetical protein
MFSINVSEPNQMSSEDKAATTTTSILRKSTESLSSNNGDITNLGTTMQYEGTKPSKICSSSYLSDSRYTPQPEPLGESTQMKIISDHEDEMCILREQKATDRLGSPGRRLLSSLLRKKVEQEEDDEDFSTIVVPKLSPDDRKKHRDFFEQLDESDDDDSTPVLDISTDDSQETSKSSATTSEKSVHETLQDHGVESFPTFLQRMYCGCMGMEYMSSEKRPKGVKINPVATVYSINSPKSLLDEE